MCTGVRSRKRERLARERRKDKVTLILLVLLMLSGVILGLYLASKGLHPKQLRRRRISQTSHEIRQVEAPRALSELLNEPP